MLCNGYLAQCTAVCSQIICNNLWLSISRPPVVYEQFLKPIKVALQSIFHWYFCYSLLERYVSSEKTVTQWYCILKRYSNLTTQINLHGNQGTHLPATLLPDRTLKESVLDLQLPRKRIIIWLTIRYLKTWFFKTEQKPPWHSCSSSTWLVIFRLNSWTDILLALLWCAVWENWERVLVKRGNIIVSYVVGPIICSDT